jgi:hypothetical protein
MFTYLTDSNTLEYYDSSQWVPFSAGGAGGLENNFMLMGA